MIDGVMAYHQETYHEAIYAQHHLKERNRTFLAAGNAGSVRPGRYRQNRSWRANWSVGQLAVDCYMAYGASMMQNTPLAESLFCFLPAPVSVLAVRNPYL
ncbi:hypothetical protein KCP74_03660 [Salmonella enterica subsp. enterica]|nr:hypothetical protein KCP74_03660 [Salmonella enterica subsp. enterica]